MSASTVASLLRRAAGVVARHGWRPENVPARPGAELTIRQAVAQAAREDGADLPLELATIGHAAVAVADIDLTGGPMPAMRVALAWRIRADRLDGGAPVPENPPTAGPAPARGAP